MKHLLFALLFSCALASPSLAENSSAPGLVEQKIMAPHHSRAMGMAIWYPASAGALELFADNSVFAGGNVRRNGVPLGGKHPVVLLSHGMGGTYLSLNWLASALAEKGAIVISVNHPNGWFGDRDMSKMFNHWTRAQDMETALDHVLADPQFAAVIDPDRIYATGFSFGGWTALSLGGARANPEGNMAYCKAAGARSHNCTDLAKFGLDPAKLDDGKWTASYKDKRIKAVAAIEPGLTWKMTWDDVADLEQQKVLIIGLGTGVDRMYPTDTSAKGSGFEQLIPKARVEVFAPATHFTAMPLCKPKGEAILAEEKDDPVCTDPAGTNRAQVHARIVDAIARQFGL